MYLYLYFYIIVYSYKPYILFSSHSLHYSIILLFRYLAVNLAVNRFVNSVCLVYIFVRSFVCSFVNYEKPTVYKIL